MTDAVGGGEDEGKLVWLIGLYALAVGGALIVLAFRVRGAPRRESSRVR